MKNHCLLLASALFAFGLVEASAADTSRSFVVPANDGYGLAECLRQGSACGAIVADALCETKGFKKSASFGELEAADITASVRASSAAAQGFVVTCAE